MFSRPCVLPSLQVHLLLHRAILNLLALSGQRGACGGETQNYSCYRSNFITKVKSPVKSQHDKMKG